MKKYTFEAIIAAIGSFFAFLFGTWDMPLIVLLVFIALDYITGLSCALIHKTVSSEIGVKGLLKKAMIMVVLIVAVLLDRLIECEWVIRSSVSFFYIANEAISVIENAGVLGLPIPQKLLDVLAQLRDKGDKVMTISNTSVIVTEVSVDYSLCFFGVLLSFLDANININRCIQIKLSTG